jgi:hypothetical protein
MDVRDRLVIAHASFREIRVGLLGSDIGRSVSGRLTVVQAAKVDGYLDIRRFCSLSKSMNLHRNVEFSDLISAVCVARQREFITPQQLGGDTRAQNRNIVLLAIWDES